MLCPCKTGVLYVEGRALDTGEERQSRSPEVRRLAQIQGERGLKQSPKSHVVAGWLACPKNGKAGLSRTPGEERLTRGLSED